MEATLNISSNINHKYLKSYEQKILDLSTELQKSRNEHEQLKTQYEGLASDLKNAQQSLQHKTKILALFRSKNQKLTTDKLELKNQYKNSQTIHKTVYDSFLSLKKSSLYNNVNDSQFFDRYYGMSEQLFLLQIQSYQTTIKQLQQFINTQNHKFSELNKQLMKSKKQTLQMTNEYQIQIQELQIKNKYLQQKSKDKLMKLEQLLSKLDQDNNMILRCKKLEIQNKTLEEKLIICNAKISESYQQINNLRKKYSESLTSQKPLNKESILEPSFIPISKKIYNYNQLQNSLEEKRKLKKQLAQIKQHYDNFKRKFPQYMKNENFINEVLQKWNRVQILQTNMNIQKQQIQSLQTKISSLQKSHENLNEKMMKRIKKVQGQNKFQEIIICKLNQFIKMMNPHFNIYRYEQLGLTQEQITKLQEIDYIEDRQTKYIKKIQYISKTQNYIVAQKLQIQLNHFREKVETMKKYMFQAQQKILNLQGLVGSLMEKQKLKTRQEFNEPKYSLFLDQVTKIQNQRNNLEITVSQQQIELAKMLSQNIKLQDESIRNKSSKSDEFLLNNIPDNTLISSQLLLINTISPTQESDMKTKIQNLSDKLRQTERNSLQQKQQIIKHYQNIVQKLNQKINKLLNEIQNMRQDSIGNALGNKQSIEREDLESQINQHGTLMEIDEQIMPNQDLQMPLNTLSAEAIEDLSRLLNGHETILKNVLGSMKQLEKRLHFLETQRENLQIIKKQSNEKSQNIKNLEKELSLSMTRLFECDKNLLLLEQELRNKTNQLNSLHESYKQESQISVNKIEAQQKKLQQLNQLLDHDKQADTYINITNKSNNQGESYGQEVEFLVSLLQKKRTDINFITKQLEKARNLLHKNQQSCQQKYYLESQMNSQQQSQLKSLINSNINQTLSKAIIALRIISQQHRAQ